MLSRTITLFFFLFVVVYADAQSRIYLSATGGMYAMKMMKDFQDDVVKSMDEGEGIKLKPVMEFPPSLQITSGFLMSLNGNNFAGAYLNYTLTKGRLHYSDYSGEAYFDQLISRAVLGVEFRNCSESGWYFYFRAGMNYSWLKLISATRLTGGNSSEASASFYSLGVDAEPGFGWQHNLGNHFNIGVNVGFDVNVQGKTFFREDSNAYLTDGEGDPVKLNWSGARLGLEFTYLIGE